jgi:hypothetical protein
LKDILGFIEKSSIVLDAAGPAASRARRAAR